MHRKRCLSSSAAGEQLCGFGTDAHRALDFRASELCSDAASRSSDGQRAMLAAQLKDFEAPQIGKYSELCLQHVPAEGPRIASSSVEWFG